MPKLSLGRSGKNLLNAALSRGTPHSNARTKAFFAEQKRAKDAKVANALAAKEAELAAMTPAARASALAEEKRTMRHEKLRKAASARDMKGFKASGLKPGRIGGRRRHKKH